MTFDAKIIAEIVFFYQVGLSGVCSKWEWTEYQKIDKKMQIGEKRKKYEISDCLPSHFEYICNNPIRYKKTISTIISASKFI